MADNLTKEKRSWNMGRIKSSDTRPELFLRSILHKNGFRFRKNVGNLPGKPDIVLKKYKIVFFVNGCFWHRHKNCKYAYMPKSRKAFWLKKFQDNTRRDRNNYRALRKSGWKVVVVWECELKDPEKIQGIILLHLKNID